MPADTAVALGAFLSHRGVTVPLVVFLVCWSANVAGASGVYFTARRYGGDWFRTGSGRHLLSPAAISTIEREYIRFGLVGILLTRFLPGIRAVVPPFAGLAGLSPARALIPIALASGIWYGAITVAGATIGAEWETILRLLGQLNRTLAVAAGLGLVVFGLIFWRWRRRRRRRLRHSFGRALVHRGGPGSITDDGSADSTLQAVATLLLELAYADRQLPEPTRRAVVDRLRARWALDGALAGAERAMVEGDLADRVANEYGAEERLWLLRQMVRVAWHDGTTTEHELRMIGRAAELLGLDERERDRVLAEAKPPSAATGESR